MASIATTPGYARCKRIERQWRFYVFNRRTGRDADFTLPAVVMWTLGRGVGFVFAGGAGVHRATFSGASTRFSLFCRKNDLIQLGIRPV